MLQTITYTQLSACPPTYTTINSPVPCAPSPVSVGDRVKVGNASPSLQQQRTTDTGPLIYNTDASQEHHRNFTKRTYKNYHGRQSVGLGVTMIIAGVLCIIFSIVTILQIKFHISIFGVGIWSGVMFIITGISGVALAKKKTMCKIMAFMALCIVSSALCLVLFICSTISTATIQNKYYCNHIYNYRHTVILNEEYPSACTMLKVMEALLACLAVIVTVCTIWGSVLCCKAVCCCAGTGQVLVPVHYIPMQGIQCSTTAGIITASDLPSASGGLYNMPDNFPYNSQLYGQRPSIYNEYKVPLWAGHTVYL